MGSKIESKLVSTIIPVYNRPEMLKEAVESVIQQTYRPIEIIIVDDGSTDSTLEIARKLAEQYSEITVLTQKNAGPGVAREAGRKIVRGEFIQYLDSDDLLLPDKFRLQVKGLLEHPDCDIAYGKECQIQLGDEPDWVACKNTGEKFNKLFPKLLRSTLWGTSVPLYRRQLLDKVGSWSSLSAEEDWEYDARAGSLNPELFYCEEFIALQRMHDNHLSAGGAVNPIKLKHRALAREKIYDYALLAGVSHDIEEMRHFSKYAFLLSRQCAVAGVQESARNLFRLSIKSNGKANLKHNIYRCLTLIFGWKNTARLAQLLE